jgi:4'-phosphopantetheinyl transferase
MMRDSASASIPCFLGHYLATISNLMLTISEPSRELQYPDHDRGMRHSHNNDIDQNIDQRRPDQMKEVSISIGDPKRYDSSRSHAYCKLEVPNTGIDVWSVLLDEPAKKDSGASPLSPDEIARADRFHFDRDRLRFTRCRSALRDLLSGYLAIPSAEIRFEYPASGKPQLVAEQNPRALQFNVSHSADMALIAIGSEHRLGVDIEKIREDVDTKALAERFFSLREREGLRALPEQLRVPGFYACWTRKEAFLKATGDGLSFPLADFSVTTHPNLAPELEEIRGNIDARKQWVMADLKVDGYRAAVAIESVRTL